MKTQVHARVARRISEAFCRKVDSTAGSWQMKNKCTDCHLSVKEPEEGSKIYLKEPKKRPRVSDSSWREGGTYERISLLNVISVLEVKQLAHFLVRGTTDWDYFAKTDLLVGNFDVPEERNLAHY